MTHIKEAIDDVDINAHVPNRVAKDLLGVIGTSLSVDSCPAPADLRGFWRKVERAIEGLNSQVSLRGLTSRGCHNLGPVILGEPAYTAIKSEVFHGWEDFKRVVSFRFGLTEEELVT